jgi:Na+/H+ antiporter NhaD/arsenite permease-like protein
MQPNLPGTPGLAWGLPFVGVLLSIALFPILAPRLWHRRMGAVVALWVAALVGPEVAIQGAAATAAQVWHAVLTDYLPFVTLLLALFAAGGGILLQGGPGGTPHGNTAMLALGTVMAGLMGTTGAAMVLIHPYLRSNAHRRRKLHLVVFFIILVANAGGAITPLGDPPLYIGFLHGVPFDWPLTHLIRPLLVLAWPLLVAFYILDRRLAAVDPRPPPQALRLRGLANVGLVAVVVMTVLLQGLWHPGAVTLFGQAIGIERLAACAINLGVAGLSAAVTPRAVRQGNMFTWAPMQEIAKLFLAIFITAGPVLAMLAAGLHGPLSAVLRLSLRADGTPSPAANFWLTGLLSAFLDNAPTYLVFFQMHGIDPSRLGGAAGETLRGISAGAVFFGALTYIGNAPNMMVRAIASQRGVRMPGFFGYCLWSVPLLLPIFALLTWLFF